MRALRRWLHDPPQWRPVVAVGYMVAVALGVVALVAPPRTIESQLGDVLTAAWGVLTLVGGIGGLATVYTRWWWAERLSILVIGVGLAMYASQVVWLALTAEGNRGAQIGVMALSALFFVLRFVQITGWDYKPPRGVDEWR